MSERGSRSPVVVVGCTPPQNYIGFVRRDWNMLLREVSCINLRRVSLTRMTLRVQVTMLGTCWMR